MFFGFGGLGFRVSGLGFRVYVGSSLYKRRYPRPSIYPLIIWDHTSLFEGTRRVLDSFFCRD